MNATDREAGLHAVWAARQALHRGTMTKFDTDPDQQWDLSDNAWHPLFSNFAATPITWTGETWPTTEHAFAAAKTLDIDMQRTIREAVTPGRAKRLGRKVTLRTGWDEGLCFLVMIDLIAAKAQQVDKFRRMLQNTGTRPIVEVTAWNDTRWGTTPQGRGANMLGQILMHERTKW